MEDVSSDDGRYMPRFAAMVKRGTSVVDHMDL